MTARTPASPASWANWGGNQSFAAERIERPRSEADAAASVRRAIAGGHTVRAAGGGHSFTPIVAAQVLLRLDRLTGVLDADSGALRATVLAGTTIADAGAPLWDAGVALANQGDIDAQTMSGAIATGTKGSGRSHGSLSSMLRAARIINGHGEVVDITEEDTAVLHAAQVSIGLLGVMTRLRVEVVPRYRLVEENRVMAFAQVAEEWDHLLETYRHFSFWWCPFEGSAAMYELGDIPADHCVVKLLREARPEEPDVTGVPNARTDRSHRIFPDGTTEAKFHELEYMVPAGRAKEAVEVMRRLQLGRFTGEASPLQVRWQRADQGYLSAQYGRDTTSLSVSGVVGTSYEPFLRAVDRELQPFGARPHWGKIHFLTPDRVRALYPRFDDFQAVRRQFDPRGVFLNDHLRRLFGE